jgi:hypothetical protein
MNNDKVFESERCPWCGVDTAWGSGNYVNRLSTYTDSATVAWLTDAERAEYRFVETYACAGCSGYECGICDKTIPLDEDITDGFEFDHYHTYCLPLDKWHETCLEWYQDLSLQQQEAVLTKPIKEAN